jgi:glucan 1,3-beta-glucosidase
VPFWTVGFLNSPKSGAQPVAETVFAGLFGAAALYIIFNEGSNNWQSLWTCAAYLLLGITLWRPRTVAVAESELIAATAVLREVGSVAQTAGTK